MSKCINSCPDPAEQNITWATSRGTMSANFCGVCCVAWWNKYKNTPAGSSAIFGGVKSQSELAATCAEYRSGVVI